jgi:cleavage stimulation factor subunit 2
MVHDLETGKPRGFAFIEFEDPQAALSAIRNMNDYELNGRRIRVNFSISSHLEALAGNLGMDLGSTTSTQQSQPSVSAGTEAVGDALKGFSKSEMYDVVAKLKEIADRDPDEARRLLSGHPQLPEAMLHLMSKLDMIQTPIVTAPPTVLTMAPPPRAADPRQRPADPRAAAVPPPPPPPPPAAVAAPAMDPRQRMDPRQQQQQQQQQQQRPPQPYGVPPPPPPQQQNVVANLDPALVQQVMSLTMEQIAQLPPDKQQSILALRQQITGGM